VAIFSKYLPISTVEDIPGHPHHSQEGRVITIEFEKFYLLTAYIPNAGQKLDRLKYRTEDWDKCFQDYCNQLKKKKTVILCGDLNVVHNEIDIARPKGNEKSAGFTKEERESFSKFLQTGWVDTFRKLHPDTVKYSWWSMRTGGRAKGIGWRLDYFLINDSAFSQVKDSMINNDIYGSDHCPIELVLELK
jgi:exodeoxyribonuclease III